MRVLLSTFAAAGHVLPPLPLALALRDAGHDVAWVTEKRAHGPLLGQGLEVFDAGLSRQELGERIEALRPNIYDLPPRESPEVMFPLLFGEIAAPALLPQLEAIVDAWRPDVLVHDAAELAAPIVAAAGGIPKVTFDYGAPTAAGRLGAAAERVAPLWRSRGLQARPWAGTRDPVRIGVFPRSLLASTVAVPTDVFIGTTASAGLPVTSPSVRPADAQSVYVTFGTAYNVRAADALASAARAVAALGLRCIVTVGHDGDPAALSDLPADSVVERFIPQTAILGQVAAVVCQAGSGTILGALAFGVPVLALPQGADQFINAELVAAAGAGLSLEPGTATGEAIGSAVRELLDDPRYREAAGRIRDEIAALPTPSDIAESFESIIAIRGGT